MKEIQVYLNDAGYISNILNPEVVQYSSDSKVVLYALEYFDSVNITFSSSDVKQFMKFMKTEGKYYIYEYELTEYVTATEEDKIGVSFKCYTKDDNNYLQVSATPNVDLKVYRSDIDKEYDYTYNAKDVDNLWMSLGRNTKEINDTNKLIQDIKDIPVTEFEDRINTNASDIDALNDRASNIETSLLSEVASRIDLANTLNKAVSDSETRHEKIISDLEAKVSDEASAREASTQEINASLEQLKQDIIDGKVDLTPYAKTTEVKTLIDNLINGAPGTMDTLKELSDAISGNKDLISSIRSSIINKADKSDVYTKSEVDAKIGTTAYQPLATAINTSNIGYQTVSRAERDLSGNVITTTYAKKSDIKTYDLTPYATKDYVDLSVKNVDVTSQLVNLVTKDELEKATSDVVNGTTLANYPTKEEVDNKISSAKEELKTKINTIKEEVEGISSMSVSNLSETLEETANSITVESKKSLMFAVTSDGFPILVLED